MLKKFFDQFTMGAGVFEDPIVVYDLATTWQQQVVLVKSFKQTALKQASSMKNEAFKEVLLMESCRHEHVAELMDVFLADVPRLVFRWGDGSMLLHHVVQLKRCLTWSVAARANMFQGLLEAVDFLHGRSVVHQCLTPSSVCVHFSDLVPTKMQILDLHGSSAGMLMDAPFGSWDYRAPEILLGSVQNHPAQDVWSVGVLLALATTCSLMFAVALDPKAYLLSVFRVLGPASDLDCAFLMNLPKWTAECAQHFVAHDWQGPLRGAGALLELMLTYTPTRRDRRNKQ